MVNSKTNIALKRVLQVLAIAASLAVAALAQTAAPAEYTYTADAIKAHVQAISAGATNSDRADAIRKELLKLKIRVSTEGFNTGGKPGTEITGTNIIAEIPNPDAKRVIMIGAHMDRVSKGSGAIDNASGSAAVLELLKAFAARPMKNVTLKAAFWDAEERGLVGSKTWVKTRKEGELPGVYINFDVFGYGNMLWLWATDFESEYAKAFSLSAAALSQSHSISKEYPPSDHLSFNVPGVQSYSFSLLTSGEVASVQKFLSGKADQNAPMPDVLRIIHTDGDTPDKINAGEVAGALPAVERSIRILDK